MIYNKDVINCLPLLASALGHSYGVEVRIGGESAWTNGKIIHIPALSLNCGKTALAMVKGYIDHESAHIRYTDFELLSSSSLDNVTRYLFNSIEDWRVESRLSELYPGCRRNLDWLIRKLFLTDEKPKAGDKNPAFAILAYVLLTVRSWNVPELKISRKRACEVIRKSYPGLENDLDGILVKVHRFCPDTRAALAYAREMTSSIKNYQIHMESQQPENKNPTGQFNKNHKSCDKTEASEFQQADQAMSNTQEEDKKAIDQSNQKGGDVKQTETSNELESHMGEYRDNPAESFKQSTELEKSNTDSPLKTLLDMPVEKLPKSLGELLEDKLSASPTDKHTTKMEVAICGSKIVNKLNPAERDMALRNCNALKQRIQGLLQSIRLAKVSTGRRGQLNPYRLHRLRIGNPRIFHKENMHHGQNSAIHILLDVSGSMKGEPIMIARQACYATAKALEGIKGVNPAVTVFPADTFETAVYPLVRHGERVSDKFDIEAYGCTPLGPALWWVLQTLYGQKEERKIVLIITDGLPDEIYPCRQAINQMRKLGMEIYGLGIRHPFIEQLLPGKSRCINSLSELAPAMFGLLQGALMQGGGHDDSC